MIACVAVMSGLIDSHLHLQWAGLQLLRRLGPERSAPEDALAALDEAVLNEERWREPTLEERLTALHVIQPLLSSTHSRRAQP